MFADERRDGQDFVVDVVARARHPRRGRTDDLARTVHYGELAAALADAVRRRARRPDRDPRRAARADVCVADPRVVAAEVTVHKPQAPIAETFGDVAVTVRRTRAELFPPPRDGVLALGSNLGDRAATLAAAVTTSPRSPGSTSRPSRPWSRPTRWAAPTSPTTSTPWWRSAAR